MYEKDTMKQNPFQDQSWSAKDGRLVKMMDVRGLQKRKALERKFKNIYFRLQEAKKQ